MRHLLRLLLLLVVAGVQTRAQVPEWEDISGRLGFSGLYELSDGTLFARHGEVMYRSTDDGITWEDFRRPGGDIMAFLTAGDLAIIGTFTPGVFNTSQYFATLDRGENWDRVFSSRLPMRNVMLSATGTAYRLGVAGNRITVERLWLDVWEQVGNPSSVIEAGSYLTASVSVIDAAGNIYIGTTYDGIHSSRDSALTWTSALPYRNISVVSVVADGRAVIASRPDLRTNGGVYLTENGGLTWTPIGLTNENVSDLGADANGTIFAVTSTGIYRYRNSTSWDTLGPFDFAYDILHITRSGRYFATAEGLGMLVSADSGRTWEPDGVRRQEIYSLCTAPDGSILVGTVGRGIFRSTDGGAFWKQYDTDAVPDYFYVLCPSGDRVLAGTERGLYRSDDNGVSWLFLTDGLNPEEAFTPVYAVVVRPDGALFIGTGSGVYVSTDDGLTWTQAGLQDAAVRSLCTAPGQMVYALTVSGGVFSTSGEGNAWISRGLVRPDLQTMAVSVDGRVAVGAWHRTYVSGNGGVSWDSGFSANGHVYALLFNGNHQIYAGTSEGVFVTEEGLSWRQAGLNPDDQTGDPGQFVVTLAYDARQSILAGSYKGGIFRTAQVITPVTGQEEIPRSVRLRQNYPNPFNPVTTIAFDVPRLSSVSLTICDLLGRVVARPLSGIVAPGMHQTAWNATDAPSGIYYCRLRVVPVEDGTESTGSKRAPIDEIRKMVLVR